MPGQSAEPAWLTRLGPVRAGFFQALLEGCIGAAILLLIARLLGADSALLVVLTFLVLLWLIWWPAWRLRRFGPRRWWMHFAAGTARALLAGSILALAAWLLSRLLSPPVFGLLGQGASFVVLPGYCVVRLLVVLGVALARPVQRRLRWQLMASHIAVILLVVITLTSTGSIIGLALFARGIQPDAPAMATSVADDLQLAGAVAPFDQKRVNQVLDRIARGSLPLRGEPALAGVIPARIAPQELLVVTPGGRLLASAVAIGESRKVRSLPVRRTWSKIMQASPATWYRLRGLALAGRSGSVPAPAILNEPRSEVVAEAPLRGANDAVTAIVLLEVSNLQPSSRQFVSGVIALFGVSTVGLVLIISLPMLGASFLISYLGARSLTERLEAVSRVANSIATGNLRERAPVRSRNEVGALAEDINRMAVHLEMTVNELEQARAQAEAALRARQDLVANVSHELRTPLAVIRAQLESLLVHQTVSVPGGGGEGDGALAVPAGSLRALEDETERLASLVDELFALSRVETGGLQVRSVPVDVAATLQELADVMRPLADREGAVAINIQAAPGLPPAMADPERLRQILANLVRNAVRHTPEGGIIALSAEAEGSSVVISVADTGEGIAPDHLPHVFERFYRADQARSRAGGGAGLGLAIVREFVELMGGRVTVESVPGEGSCFRVYLPAASTAP